MVNDDATTTSAPRNGSEVRVDANQLWQTALADLEKRISSGPFSNYFRKTTLLGIEDDTATISTPNPITANTLENRYASQIERTLSAILGRKITAIFAISGRHAEQEPLPGRPPRPGR
ncbi:MAG: DnaA N-terminal domain-containing protein, partial [Thermomicrobiales bacterium]